ncbi:hypothetical protein CFU_0028 [Collimonas fungivorans Ter331]|uniref:Uncharacterized protein n=1 Tax=Collimonas fungivorans (strain Ter331) TaxID=1005048 RepID=G0A7V6_COLFT|nr:hypothetical protein CFU_0028 [Collimonas fungivorans Ter331]
MQVQPVRRLRPATSPVQRCTSSFSAAKNQVRHLLCGYSSSEIPQAKVKDRNSSMPGRVLRIRLAADQAHLQALRLRRFEQPGFQPRLHITAGAVAIVADGGRSLGAQLQVGESVGAWDQAARGRNRHAGGAIEQAQRAAVDGPADIHEQRRRQVEVGLGDHGSAGAGRHQRGRHGQLVEMRDRRSRQEPRGGVELDALHRMAGAVDAVHQHRSQVAVCIGTDAGRSQPLQVGLELVAQRLRHQHGRDGDQRRHVGVSCRHRRQRVRLVAGDDHRHRASLLGVQRLLREIADAAVDQGDPAGERRTVGDRQAAVGMHYIAGIGISRQHHAAAERRAAGWGAEICGGVRVISCRGGRRRNLQGNLRLQLHRHFDRYLRPSPHQLVADAGGSALSVAHRIPVESAGAAHVAVVDAARISRGARGCVIAGKTQAVADFMGHHIQEIGLALGRTAIQPVIPALAGGADVDVGGELRLDIVFARVVLGAAQGIGERGVVPGIGQRRIGEIAVTVDRAGLAQDIVAGGILAQRRERGLHPHRHCAVEQRAVHLEGKLIDQPALFAQGLARIAAHRRRRGQVIQSSPGRILVDQDKIGGMGRRHTSKKDDKSGTASEGFHQRTSFFFCDATVSLECCTTTRPSAPFTATSGEGAVSTSSTPSPARLAWFWATEPALGALAG